MKIFKARQTYLLFISILSVFFMTGCDGGTGHWDGGDGEARQLVSIEVTTATASIPVDLTKSFVATGTYSDGTTDIITTDVTWTSDNTPVATVVSTTGVATGVSAGEATITATLNDKSGSAILTVTDATLSSIAVTPATATIPVDLTKTFAATGTYSDGTTHIITTDVTWTSGNTPVATVASTTGVATGRSVGSATITATFGTNSGSATLNVTDATLSSIAVTPATATVVAGRTRSFVATGTYSDGTTDIITTDVTWTSDNTPVATVLSTTGVATGRSVGSATITATFGTKSGSATLTVTDATLSSIAVTPATATVVDGRTRSFVATGTYSDGTTDIITTDVTWTSDNTPVATVLSTTGVATGRSVGSATITATFGTKSSSAILTVTDATLSSIAVTPATATVVDGRTRSFVATGTYSDGTTDIITTDVTWTSGNTPVATVVSTTGVATGRSVGSATITATLGTNSSSATLTVTDATLSSIEVTPATATVVDGRTRSFVATGTYSDGSTDIITTDVTWTSDNTPVATVLSTSGVATGRSVGSATITATLNGQSASAILTVTAATLNSIAVTPETATVEAGLTKTFVATGTYSDGTTDNITNDVTWTSNNTPVATVLSTTGVATGLSAGEAAITARLSGQSGFGTLTVETGIVLDPNPDAPVLGEAGRFVILASQKITTTVGSAISNGDMGILDQARTYYEGFTEPADDLGHFNELTNGYTYAHDDMPPAYVIPAPYASTIAFIDQVRTDLNIAYDFLAADPNPAAPTQVCPIQLGGQVLTRGVYKTDVNVSITTGPLYLDAQGDPDSVFIFSIGGTLTTGAPGGNIVLQNGAKAKNVFFRTGDTTVIGAGTIFYGNVFAWSQVNVLANANITGRLFALTDQVTLISDIVTKAP